MEYIDLQITSLNTSRNVKWSTDLSDPLLRGRRTQPVKRKEFPSPHSNPSLPSFSFKAETQRVPPFFFLSCFLQISVLKRTSTVARHFKTAPKVWQTQRRNNGHIDKSYQNKQVQHKLTARPGNTTKRLSDNPAVFQRAQRHAERQPFKGRSPKHKSVLALRMSLLKSKCSMAGPRLHWFVQCLGNNLLI